MENDNKKGRPTTYDPGNAEQAYKLCLLGATDEQLADFFEVSRITISHWKQEHPLFLDALRRGKLTADGAIAESLFKCAQGYELTETTERIIYNGQVESVTIKKKCMPNVTAAIFWLKNRQKQTWNDKYRQPVVEPARETIEPVFFTDPGKEPGFEADQERSNIIADAQIFPSPLIARKEEARG